MTNYIRTHNLFVSFLLNLLNLINDKPQECEQPLGHVFFFFCVALL